MEAEQQRQPIILHMVPLLPQQQIKALIIDSLPQLKLIPAHIRLTRKDDKYQAYLMVPASKVKELISLKQLTLGKQKVFIRKCFGDFHVFVSKLPDGLTVQDVHTAIQAQFGKVLKVQDELPHQGAKSKVRHCYIRFENEQDAEKCILSPKKILVKGFDLKVARAYAIGENEDTDKKLFLKVISQIEDLEDLERTINDTFNKQGKLRERIRVDSGKAVATFTSGEVADRVLFQFKTNKIGKYDVLVRPFASKQNFTIFLGGLVNTITSAQLEQALSSYQPLLSCNIIPSNNPLIRNGSATFGSQQTFRRILAEYKDDPELKPIFSGNPYITVHMSSKDRSEYNSFKKGKTEPQVKKLGLPPMGFGMPMGMPMGLQMGAPMMFAQQHQAPIYGGINRPPYGLHPQQQFN